MLGLDTDIEPPHYLVACLQTTPSLNRTRQKDNLKAPKGCNGPCTRN